jgi:acyl-coenzyme A synthetase/AMP-(fatty) acid ligase
LAALGLPPRPMTSPLFTAWFNDLTQGARAPDMPGLTVEPIPTPGFAALFELNFYLHRGRDGYRLQLVRAIDRVRADVAGELLDQCVRVLRQVLANDQTPLSEFSLVTDRAEEAWLAAGRTGRRRALPPSITGAVGRESAVALSTPAGDLTYAEVDRAVSALADELASAGVTTGTVVEIRARRAGGTVVAFLATRRLGAVAAVVDVALPSARLAEHRRLLRPACAVSVDPDARARARVEPLDPEPRSVPGASHILMTSGSGGRPVAVVTPDGAVENALAWYTEEFAPTAVDRVALLAGLGHDPVLRDMLVPLRSGGTLVVPPQDVFAVPTRLLDFLVARGITILHATPALLEVLLVAHAEAPQARLDAVRLVISAGAPLTAGLVRRLRGLTPAAVVNAYGTTETPQIAARHQVLRHGQPAEEVLAEWPDEAVLPLGSGVAGVGLLVRTDGGAPAGVGQVGHVVVRGADLATGYLDQDAPDRFVPDPYAVRGTRAFVTGDLGRLGPDGLVHFVGRGDRQITIDGFRVEPDEVEAVVRGLPAVAQAVAGLVDTPAGPTFAIEVVAAPGRHLDADTVRSHLRARLPGYAVPSAVTVVAGLTRSRNHKVMLGPGTVPAPAVESPDADVTGWLGDLFRQVLGHDVAPDQSFFDAGFTSMSLLRLHAHMASAIKDPPPATALFAYPTPRAFARYLVTRETQRTPGQRGRGVDLDRVREEAQRRRAVRRGRRGH